MLPQPRILFGIITKSHTELALDEMYGLQNLGYACEQFEYGAKKEISSKIGRFYVLFLNAFKLLIKTHKFKPDFIFLNSRLEYVAGTRDFITIFILRTLYFRKLNFLLKSHGSDLEVLQTKRPFYSKIVFPFLKKNISGWLFLSTEEINWIRSHKLIKDEKLFLSKNIVRIEKFKKISGFKEKIHIPEDHMVALYVGRLIEEKGIHFVVDAFARISKKHKITLIIVGDGGELDSIKSKVKSLKIEHLVRMTGWVDENEASFYTSNSDLLIFPTYFPEGFPMVLFNSLAAGLSVITTPTRAAIDYLEEPENCIWVEPKSVNSIIDGVNRLFADDQLMTQMRKNNKTKSFLFTKSVVATELSAILSAVRTGQYSDEFIQVKK